ncbi:serine-rich adhesin for platelets isoform X2 [Parasteatoda tepidariorum]|uniref:serine-rich adhesin for platelets isoform X2 n=1 Tax=Parasteatoda tepidariorum TaxID=114398 RepID=UPI0039BD29F5
MSQRRQKKNKQLAACDLPEYRTRSGRRVKKPDRWNPTEASIEIARGLHNELENCESTRRSLNYDEKKIDKGYTDLDHVSEALSDKTSDSCKNIEESNCLGFSDSVAVDSLSEPAPNIVINPKINVTQSISKINTAFDSFDDSLNEPLSHQKKLVSNLVHDNKSSRKSREKQLLSSNNFYDSLEDICSLASNMEKISGSESAKIIKNVTHEKSIAVDSLIVDACPKGDESDNGEQHFEEDSLAIIEYEKAFDDSLEEAELIEMLNVSHIEEKVIQSVEYAANNAVECAGNNTTGVTHNLFQTTEYQIERNSFIAEKSSATQFENECSLSSSDCIASKDSLESSDGDLAPHKKTQCKLSNEYEVSTKPENLIQEYGNASIDLPKLDTSASENQQRLNSSNCLPPSYQHLKIVKESRPSNEQIFENIKHVGDNSIITAPVTVFEQDIKFVHSNDKSVLNSEIHSDALITVPSLKSNPNNSMSICESNGPINSSSNVNKCEGKYEIHKNGACNLSSDNIQNECFEPHDNKRSSLGPKDSSRSDELLPSVSENCNPEASSDISMENPLKNCHLSEKNNTNVRKSINNNLIGSSMPSLEDEINNENNYSCNLSCNKSNSELLNSSSREEITDVNNENCSQTYLMPERTSKAMSNVNIYNLDNFKKGLIMSKPEANKIDDISNEQLFSVSPSEQPSSQNKTKMLKCKDSEHLPGSIDESKTFLEAQYSISPSKVLYDKNKSSSKEDKKQNDEESTKSKLFKKHSKTENANNIEIEGVMCSNISSNDKSNENCRNSPELSKDICAEDYKVSIKKVSETINAKPSTSSVSSRMSASNITSTDDSKSLTWNSHENESLTVNDNSNNISILISENVHVTTRTESSTLNQDISSTKDFSFMNDSMFQNSNAFDVDEKLSEVTDEVVILTNESGFPDDSICILHDSNAKIEFNAKKSNEAAQEQKITSASNETIWIDNSICLVPESDIKSEIDEELNQCLSTAKNSQIMNDTICIEDSICIPQELNIFQTKIKKENSDYSLKSTQSISTAEETFHVNDTICIDDTMCFHTVENNIKIENQDSDEDDTYYSCSSEIDSEKFKLSNNSKSEYDNDLNAAISSNLRKQIAQKVSKVAKSKPNDGNLVKLQIKVAVRADQVNILSILPPEDKSQNIFHNPKESADLVIEPTDLHLQSRTQVSNCSSRKVMNKFSSTDTLVPENPLAKITTSNDISTKSELNSQVPKLIEALDLHDVSLCFTNDRLVDSRDSIKPLNLCLKGSSDQKDIFQSKIVGKENIPIFETVSYNKNVLNLPVGSAKKHVLPQSDHYKSPKVLGNGTESKKSGTKIPVRKIENTSPSPVCFKFPKSDFKDKPCDELKHPFVGTIPLYRGNLFTPTIGDKAKGKMLEVTPAKSHHFCSVRNSISRVPKAPRSCPKKFQYIQSPIAQNSALPSQSSKVPGIPQVTSQKLHLQKVNKKL